VARESNSTLQSKGQFFQERIEANVDDLVSFIARTNVQVLEASAASLGFLIADDPAPSLKKGHKGLGPLGGAPWGEATTIMMPVSPRFAIALADSAEWIELDDQQTMFVNMIELAYAHEKVFYIPEGPLREVAEEAAKIRNR
jgi:hypothetical protein